MSYLKICTERQLALYRAKIDREGPLVAPSLGRCWRWTGAPMKVGYGLLTLGSARYGTRKRVLAHRFAWELTNGPIPRGTGHHGTVIMHRCDNRLCVNPDHLVAATQAVNLRDMVDKGRGKTPGLRRTSHPRAKLNEEQVRRVLMGGEPGRALAREFGVSHTAIRLIRKGVNWR